MMQKSRATGTSEKRLSATESLGFFTPVFDSVARQLGNTAANVFGAVWRFCQMSEGVCRASVRTLAERLNLNEATVHKYLKILVQANYLEDLTPHARHAPHVYRDTHKAQSTQGSTGPAAPVCETNTAFVSQTGAAESVYDARLRRQSRRDKQETKKGRPIDPAAPKASDVFELQLFRHVAGFYPSKLVFDEVIQAVRKIGERLGRPPVAEDLMPYIKAWVARGWKPTNLAWLLEWAVAGAIPKKGLSNENQTAQRTQPHGEEKQISEAQRLAIQRINQARRANTTLPNL
jgi:hypothetical protein